MIFITGEPRSGAKGPQLRLSQSPFVLYSELERRPTSLAGLGEAEKWHFRPSTLSRLTCAPSNLA